LDDDGLEGFILDNSIVLNNLACLKKLKLSKESVAEIANDFRPWIIKLKK